MLRREILLQSYAAGLRSESGMKIESNWGGYKVRKVSKS